jgi:hypothetical protein
MTTAGTNTVRTQPAIMGPAIMAKAIPTDTVIPTDTATLTA